MRYKGRMVDGQAVVMVMDEAHTVKVLTPTKSLLLRKHSPTGFAWGYEGSGPAQLALAVLLDATQCEDAALELYQAFKRTYVARWKTDEPWQMAHIDILRWVIGTAIAIQKIDQVGAGTLFVEPPEA